MSTQALGNKPRPKRTAFGKSGKPIKVNVNHYKVCNFSGFRV